MEPLTDLVVKAGAAILAVNRARMKVDGKLDGSPVTEADLAADRIIGDGLARLAPGIPALSEERAHQATPPYRGSFFLIDPLDGTKEFVAGRDEFTVNLALVTNGMPLLGIVGAPALGSVLARTGRPRRRTPAVDATRALARPSRSTPGTAPRRGEPWIAAVSRSHGDATDRSLYCRPARRGAGSSSARRSNSAGWRREPPTSTRGSRRHANGMSRPAMRVVTAAGGKVTDAKGAPLRFGAGERRRFIVPDFIAWGDPAAAVADTASDSVAANRCPPSGRSPRACFSGSCSIEPGLLQFGQRACACRRKLSGSAAKASRLSSRPNR